MAESYYPFDAGAGSASTEDRWRQMAQQWVTGGSGVLATELNKLNTFGDSTGMQVKVDTGRAWVRGHHYENDATKTLAISSNSSGNPRIDRAVVRPDATANTITALIITGTPAASPAAPALTNTSTVWDIPLAQIAVANGAVTITAGNVTDERVLVGPGLAAGKAASAAAFTLAVPSPVAGTLRDLTDLERLDRYNGSAWVPILPLGDAAIQTWTPQVDQSTTNIAKTVNNARYVELGPLVLYEFDLTITGTGTGGTAITLTLPHSPITGGTGVPHGGSVRVFDAGTGSSNLGQIEVLNGTNKIQFQVANAGLTVAGAAQNLGQIPTNWALANGDVLRGSGFYFKAA